MERSKEQWHACVSKCHRRPSVNMKYLCQIAASAHSSSVCKKQTDCWLACRAPRVEKTTFMGGHFICHIYSFAANQSLGVYWATNNCLQLFNFITLCTCCHETTLKPILRCTHILLIIHATDLYLSKKNVAFQMLYWTELGIRECLQFCTVRSSKSFSPRQSHDKN